MSGAGIDQAGAAALLAWWRDAGVDVAVRENAPAWTDLIPATASPVPQPAPSAAPVAEKADDAPRPAVRLPETLAEWPHWIEAECTARGARAVLPQGIEGAPVMMLGDRPDRADLADGRPMGGAAGAMAERMLGALGLDPQAAYWALLDHGHVPGERLKNGEIEKLAPLARLHIGHAAPRRLILFGDAAARALTDKPLAKARGVLHHVEGIPAVATFHPRWLLERPQDKRLAWDDLLLLKSETE
ncbi:uracil-DNA glycosylase family protein [Sphingomicrobium nitratireducens]|uniref:uracil-DNA glycosylase family protein n=1 Tax=Sphingomicrobium nitratireducens TaxID=2964666 RepID=UPI002240929D|nr:uracil-DNA glycosylase family protein [Sphingomicrobium nitratireducens]